MNVPRRCVCEQLDRYGALVSLDAAHKRVTVQAGMRLHALHALLASNGLALAVTGAIAEQSVAGALLTGTHGTGRAFRPMAGQIVRMQLVDGLGQVLTVDAEHDKDLFDAARIVRPTPSPPYACSVPPPMS